MSQHSRSNGPPFVDTNVKITAPDSSGSIGYSGTMAVVKVTSQYNTVSLEVMTKDCSMAYLITPSSLLINPRLYDPSHDNGAPCRPAVIRVGRDVSDAEPADQASEEGIGGLRTFSRPWFSASARPTP